MTAPLLTRAAEIASAPQAFASEDISALIRELMEALATAREDALREAVEIASPKIKRPCDCDRCDCGNIGDVISVTVWDVCDSFNSEILALIQKGPTNDA